jgi:hypothetical protein
MKNGSKSSDSAFPWMYDSPVCRGMSTRQLVGAMALQGLMAYPVQGDDDDFAKKHARLALMIADEFLKQEEETR